MVSEALSVSIEAAPEVNAGADASACQNDSIIDLNGLITGGTIDTWNVLAPADGNFSLPSDQLSTTYIPSANDVSNGTVTFELSSEATLLCAPILDTVVYTINAKPDPEILSPFGTNTFCSTADRIPAIGVANNAGGGVWTTTGSGVFSPSPNALQVEYYPSQQDKDAGEVGIIFTTILNGNCLPEDELAVFRFEQAPEIDAGNDFEVCEDIDSIIVNASIENAISGTWSASGSGSFGPAANQLSSSYLVTPADRANGFVRLTMTASVDPFSSCLAEVFEEDVLVTFTPSPQISLADSFYSCQNNPDVNLSAAVNIATGGFWSGGAGSFNPSRTDLNAVYTPTQSEIDAGGYQLNFTTSGNGTCKTYVQTTEIKVNPIPVVSIMADTICGDPSSFPLTGTVQNAGGGQWSTDGNGLFSPSALALNADYFVGAADGNQVIVTLTSTQNGTCNAVSDSKIFTFNPEPLADAGSDPLVCENSEFNLLGNVVANTRGEWYDMSGSLLNSGQSYNDVTVPGTTDFVYVVTDIIGCTGRDTVSINTIPIPTVSLPDNQCFEDSSFVTATTADTLPGGGWQWWRNGTLVSPVGEPSQLITEAGDHVIAYSIRNCRVTDTTTILPLPETTLDSIYACENSTENITTLAITGASYSWVGNAGTLPDVDNSIQVVVNAVEDYIVTVIDAAGCEQMDTATVVPVPAPQMTFTDSIGCEGTPVVFSGVPLNNVDANNQARFVWRDAANNVISNVDTVSITASGQYNLTYTLGRCAPTFPVNVNLLPAPVIAEGTDVTFCKETDEEVVLSPGEGFAQYFWPAFSSVNPEVRARDEGEYLFTVWNEAGCETTDTMKVSDVCPPRLFAPNAMVIGEDTETFGFGVEGAYFTKFKLMIFNRWGEIIFYTEDPLERWDGTYRGKPMPIGVYPWVISYEGEAQQFKGPYSLQGSVTVVR